jgi:hypothetical protein
LGITAVKKASLISYTTITVMLIVSAVQFILIRKVHISPWKAGGFGMFSTLNTPISHIIRVYNYSPDGQKQPIIIPEKLKPMETKIRHIAIDYYINSFKSAIQQEKWVLLKQEGIDPGVIKLKEQAGADHAMVELSNISVELWQYKFNAKGKKFYSKFIAAY